MKRILYFIPLVVLLILSMIRVEPKWRQFVSIEKIQQMNRIALDHSISYYNSETGSWGFSDSAAARDSSNNQRAKEIIAHLCDSMLIKRISIHKNSVSYITCTYDKQLQTHNGIVIINVPTSVELLKSDIPFPHRQFNNINDSVYWYTSNPDRPYNFLETLFLLPSSHSFRR